MSRNLKDPFFWLTGAMLGAMVWIASGCATLERKLYRAEVVTNQAPAVVVVTNQTVLTNWQTLVVTNQGAPVAAAVPFYVTNTLLMAQTQFVAVVTTQLVTRPEVTAGLEATGPVGNSFLPGLGSILALALGGLYHGYAQWRNARQRSTLEATSEVLAQGVETARQILQTAPQGRAVDSALVNWLVKHQTAAGLIGQVAEVVGTVDTPAAKIAAQEILARVQLAAPTPPPGRPAGSGPAQGPVA